AYNMPYKNVTLGLGLTALYLNNLSASGSESTFIEGFGPYNTLNYTAQGQSYGLFLEPKLAWTHYAVQPYFLLGLGVSRNDFGHYVETSINPESPSPGVPLNGYDQYNLAYEFGVGVQYVLSSKPNAPIIALDYRYINWGNAALSSYSGQEIPNNMSLGQLTSSSVNVNLIWPF
ncbi:MAG: hypothetical protein NTV32_07320, partial [Gammaproteobacteria bacterium]|nr:hypothetical protein [Gammaproteobacteria bacterium]